MPMEDRLWPKTLVWKWWDCETLKAMKTTIWMKMKLTGGEGMIFRDDNGYAACSYSLMRLAKSFIGDDWMRLAMRAIFILFSFRVTIHIWKQIRLQWIGLGWDPAKLNWVGFVGLPIPNKPNNGFVIGM
jgi:hypothetical protein